MLAKFCFFLSRQKKILKPIHVGIPRIIPLWQRSQSKDQPKEVEGGEKRGGIHRESLSDGLRMVEVFGNDWWILMRLIDFDTDHIYMIFMCIYIYTYVFFFCVFWRTKSLDLVSFILLDLGSLFHYMFCLYILSYYLFSLLIFLGIMTYCFFNCARTGHMEKYQGSMTYNSDT